MHRAQFARDIVNGMRLHVLTTDRFKTTAISVFIGSMLQEHSVTSVALIPFVLRRGNATYPDTIQFRQTLDELYGASFGFDVFKRGDYQIVNIRMDVIQDRFAMDVPMLFQQTFHFLGDTITRPAIEAGNFLEKYIEAEKHTVEKKLEALINDKGRYAAERCIEEMCKDEPYRLHPLGRREDLDQITPKTLTLFYNHWINSAPIDIYVVGDQTMDEVKRCLSNSFKVEHSDRRITEYEFAKAIVPSRPVQRIVEHMDINQGKLNIGFRISTSYPSPDYATALVFNGIFGGFPHSKLFVNVREKESLAYYASSRLDGHKGILTVQSGIQVENVDKAVDIILKQMEAIKSGDITELEIKQTKAMISNQLREINDGAYEMISFDYNSVLTGKERTVTELLDAIDRVSISDIVHVAQDVKLDTIYFLRNREEV
jgi:predicted Zn-dependent peptidase